MLCQYRCGSPVEASGGRVSDVMSVSLLWFLSYASLCQSLWCYASLFAMMSLLCLLCYVCVMPFSLRLCQDRCGSPVEASSGWGLSCQLRRGRSSLGASARSTTLWRQTLITVPPKPPRSSWPTPRSSCDQKRTQKYHMRTKGTEKGPKRALQCATFEAIEEQLSWKSLVWLESRTNCVAEEANRADNGKQQNRKGCKTDKRHFLSFILQIKTIFESCTFGLCAFNKNVF